jgi:hypothetical protein
MAKYNEILVGRFNTFLQKYFGIKGPAPAPQLAGDIQVAHSLFSGVENRFAENWRRYANAFTNPATVGLTTAMRFRNPTGSGMIAVIEKCTLHVGAAADRVNMTIRDVLTDADLGTPVSSLTLERRPYRSASGIKISNDLAGNQQGTSLQSFALSANQTYEQIFDADQQLVVDPGQWLEWFNSTANNAFDINWVWRERPIEEGELI